MHLLNNVSSQRMFYIFFFFLTNISLFSCHRFKTLFYRELYSFTYIFMVYNISSCESSNIFVYICA